jgi:tetratricopeptide (TPR) repeat protein
MNDMMNVRNVGHERHATTLQLHPRSLFLPGLLLVVFLLRWMLAVPWWGLAPFLAVVPVYFFVLPGIMARRQRALEHEVIKLLQQGRKSELMQAYRRHWLLRLFGAPARVQRQLGFINAELGDHERAAACYARAASAAPADERLGIMFGLAHARYRSGDYERAEADFREVLRRGQRVPEVLSGLSHCLVLLGRELGEALTLAKQAVSLAPDGAVGVAARLTLAEALLARGKPGKALGELDQVAVPDGDRWLDARVSWVRALLAVSDGDEADACELFEEVASLDPDGGLGDLARQRLADLDVRDPSAEEIRQAV